MKSENCFKCCAQVGFTLPGCIKALTTFATNGRDVVNMIQMAVGIAQDEGKLFWKMKMWRVINNSRLSPRPEKDPRISLSRAS